MDRKFRTPSGDRLLERASELLRGAGDAGGLARAMAEYLAAAEREVAERGEMPVACRAGCPHCCVLNVSVLLPEAAVIAFRLSENRTPAETEALVSRLDSHRRRVRWMEDDERIRGRIFCPFLDSAGSCSVYPYRPMECRGLTSLDLDQCVAALDPSDPEASRVIVMDIRRKIVMDDAFIALAAAMKQRGMETRGIELSSGVLAFLAAPDLCGVLLTGKRFPPETWE